MPVYEYACEECGERFERWFASLSCVPAEVSCPACQSVQVRRLLSAPMIHSVDGDEVSDSAEEEAPPPRPPVFGRKELEETLRSRGQKLE